MDINEKCLALLGKSGQPEPVLAHCRAVAETAEKLAVALNAKGAQLDRGLCYRGGLLHDICRTERFHAARGMLRLLEEGLEDEARIVGAHMGDFVDTDRIAEKEVVYIADKLTRGVQRVSIEERYAHSAEKFAGDTPAQRAALARREQAMRLAGHMESILGCCLHRFDEA